MTAKEIKEDFASTFCDTYVIANELRSLACSDIVAIDRNLNMREYEIKVSISDLRKELAEVDYVLSHEPEPGFLNFAANKKNKHDIYLNGVRKGGEWVRELPSFFCPATFTWLIPRKLYEKEKQRLDALPYGVMDCETFAILKAARHLKEAKKATADQLWLVAHSQTYKLLGVGDDDNR